MGTIIFRRVGVSNMFDIGNTMACTMGVLSVIKKYFIFLHSDVAVTCLKLRWPEKEESNRR